MGTNFYLRRVKPREVHDEYHIAKRSGGWKIHFQDSTEYQNEFYGDGPEPPSYHSVGDIRKLLESGEYQLSNEYGDVYEPGYESLREFDELCQWNGGPRFTQPAVPYNGRYDNPPGVPYDHCGTGGYRDPDGYYFDSREFC